MSRIELVDISPEPTEEVRAAIEMALEAVWPAPSVPWAPSEADRMWRFGERPWLRRAIPARRWGLP